jgi:hypothetical protein
MAQPGTASRGFGGRILSVVESTPGTTPSNPALIKFSDFVQSVSLSLDPAFTEWRDIGDYDPSQLVAGLPIYGVKVVYALHVNRKTQADDAMNRQADNSVKSQTIEVAVNLDGTTVGYFTLTGCKAEQATVKTEPGKPAIVELSYKALAVARATSAPSIGSGSRESAALGALSVFSASTITRGGSSLGYITRSAEFMVSHALRVDGTDGQVNPKAIFEGQRQVTGKADITLDDGGVALGDAVMAGTAASVVFSLGAAGAPKFTLANVQWDKFDLPLNVSDGVIMAGVPFRAVGPTAITTGTV